MKVHEIMTAHARCVGLDNTLVEAAGLMRELDVGALPVCDNDRLAGMITDRDIAVRGVANGCDPNATEVSDVMSPGIFYAFADADVEEAARIMEDRQIRRLPVLSRDKRLVGIISLGDIATSSNPAFSGMALRDVSQPVHATSRQRRLAQNAFDVVTRPRTERRERTRTRQTKRGRRTRTGAGRGTAQRTKTRSKPGKAGAKRGSPRGRKSPARSR